MRKSTPLALYRYALPLRHPLTFGEHRLRVREGLLVCIGAGWGDIAPLPGFSNESLDEAIPDAIQALRALADGVEPHPRHPSVQFGLACARRPWPPLVAPPVQTCGLLAGDPQAWLDRIDPWTRTLPDKVKIKVARHPPVTELALIRHVCEARPGVQLVLDANGAWSRVEATTFCRELPMDRIAYLEDPCDALIDIEAVSHATGVPVALDQTLSRGLSWAPFPGLVALVVKPTLIGAMATHRRLIARALDAGLSVVVSSSFESDVGLAHLFALAAEWSPDEHAGLDTARYFQSHACLPSGQPDVSRLELLWVGDGEHHPSHG